MSDAPEQVQLVENRTDEIRRVINAASIPGIETCRHPSHVNVEYRDGTSWVVWAWRDGHGDVVWRLEGRGVPILQTPSADRVVELIRAEANKRA
jgi:hypothetical protein